MSPNHPGRRWSRKVHGFPEEGALLTEIGDEGSSGRVREGRRDLFQSSQNPMVALGSACQWPCATKQKKRSRVESSLCHLPSPSIVSNSSIGCAALFVKAVVGIMIWLWESSLHELTY